MPSPSAREKQPRRRPRRLYRHTVAMPEVSETDFAIVVFREDDGWDADVLPVAVTDDLKGFIRVLRQQPSIAGTIGLAGIDDYFFVAIRVVGNQVSLLLSDIGAALDYPLAEQVLDYLEIPVPDEEDLDQVLPVGDQGAQAVHGGQPVAAVLVIAGRVGQPDGEFRVCGEVHIRSLAAEGATLTQNYVRGFPALCVLHPPRAGTRPRSGSCGTMGGRVTPGRSDHGRAALAILTARSWPTTGNPSLDLPRG